jgi:type IV pilus assembly protein PilM
MKAGKQKRRGPLLSIDLGSHSIKFAQGQLVNDKLKITALFHHEIPDNVYSNGDIKDELALKTAIQSAIKNSRVSTRDTVISIECTEIIKREMIIQRVPDEDRMDLIAYEVSQYLPIDVNSYILQYKIIDEVVEGEVTKDRILLGAMPKDVVKSHFDLLLACGLNPVYMDMHSNSLEKLVQVCHNSEIKAEGQTTAYIDFGNKIIDISILENLSYKFNRLLKLGSSEFDKILVGHLSLDAKQAETRKKRTSVVELRKFNQDAEDVLVEVDTSHPQAGLDVHNTELETLVNIETISYLDECIDEINKVFKYYTSRNSANKIDQVYLYGGGSQFIDLIDLFADKLELPTKVLSQFDNLELNIKNDPGKLSIYVNALGALIRS